MEKKTVKLPQRRKSHGKLNGDHRLPLPGTLILARSG